MKLCKNKWKIVWLVTICLLLIVTIRPKSVTAEESDFEIKDGVLLKYSGNEENVVIPDNVTTIGKYAFQDCAVMKQIAIPSSVKTIDDYAFCSCIGLTKVILPDTVTHLGNNLFISCVGLTEVMLPAGLTQIPDGTFENCSSLTTVYIPASVTTIGSYAFSSCKSLTSLYLPNNLTSIGSSAFQKSGLDNIVIPQSVNWIESQALKDTPWMKKQLEKNPLVIVNNVLIEGTKCKGIVKIPKEVTCIAPYAFAKSQITKVTMGNQVTQIGRDAFDSCKKLITVKLSNNIEQIQSGAFSGCTKLKSINIPKKIKELGGYCFETCISLKGEIVLPNGLITLGSYCFKDCSGITDFVFPKSVTQIEVNPFLGTAWDEDQEGDFVIINQILCRVVDYNLDEHSGCMVIPNTIKKIAPCAFRNCRMTSIVIPKSVKVIGHEAFMNTFFLEKITIPANTVLEDDLFEHSSEELMIYSSNNSKAKKYAKQYNLKFQTIDLKESSHTIAVGTKKKLSLNCMASCSWSSTNPAIASVNAKGIVTAKAPGKVLITASLYGRKYICNVTIV